MWRIKVIWEEDEDLLNVTPPALVLCAGPTQRMLAAMHLCPVGTGALLEQGSPSSHLSLGDLMSRGNTLEEVQDAQLEKAALMYQQGMSSSSLCLLSFQIPFILLFPICQDGAKLVE